MIETYALQGLKQFAISSSGNAALAAARFIKEQNQKNGEKLFLNIYIGEKIHQEKQEDLEKLASESIRIEKTKRPLQRLFEIIKSEKIKSLRQSTDDVALLGYAELAEELALIPNISAVFVPTSSGTTAQALGEMFEKMGRKIQIHIVQTSYCHPIAKEFGSPEKLEVSSTASAIVDKIVHRKEKVMEVAKRSGGFGWTISNEEIKKAQLLVKKETGIELSPNSTLGVSGLMKAIQNGWKWNGAVACLITGK